MLLGAYNTKQLQKIYTLYWGSWIEYVLKYVVSKSERIFVADMNKRAKCSS